MTVCLSVKDVHKTYGKSVALNNVSLELRNGEILGFLGPNGAGKTTLVKILATILIKDSGRVEIFGYDLDKHENDIRYLFGYVGQDTERSAYARLNVVENLQFFGTLRGLNKRKIKEQIEKLAAYFDFQANMDKQFMHLSGGQKQTVIVMRALLHDPPLVYLDEPTKGLDPVAAKRLRTFLKQYVYQEGKSLLLTSHIMSEVEELASQIALIHQGHIVVTGTAQALKAAVGVNEFVELQKEGLPPSVQEKILQLEPVLFASERDPQWVSFGVNDLFNGTEAILQTLRQENTRVMMRHLTVSLEDAFLHHVGTAAEKFE
jgi:ABC-2 type transport system ATP-binding protein